MTELVAMKMGLPDNTRPIWMALIMQREPLKPHAV
jgi:hypothetical protein